MTGKGLDSRLRGNDKGKGGNDEDFGGNDGGLAVAAVAVCSVRIGRNHLSLFYCQPCLFAGAFFVFAMCGVGGLALFFLLFQQGAVFLRVNRFVKCQPFVEMAGFLCALRCPNIIVALFYKRPGGL